MDFTQYIQPELLTLIPILNIIGYWIKNKTKINNKYIPVVLGLTGVLFAVIYTAGINGFTLSAIATGVVQGLLVAASALYANQIYKQSGKDDDEQ